MTTTVDIVNNFPRMPDEAVISSSVVEYLTGLSSRTVRRHPALPRIYVSADRYGFAVGDVRRLLRGVSGAVPRARRQPKNNAAVRQGA